VLGSEQSDLALETLEMVNILVEMGVTLSYRSEGTVMDKLKRRCST
jgi:hypothetical protein